MRHRAHSRLIRKQKWPTSDVMVEVFSDISDAARPTKMQILEGSRAQTGSLTVHA